MGETNAMIFEVHQMMLDDLDYVESVTNMISSQKINAEYAVATTGDNFANMFAAMGRRVHESQSGGCEGYLQPSDHGAFRLRSRGHDRRGTVILVADDLAPSETVQLDKSRVLSFVTRHGSTNPTRRSLPAP